MRYIVTMVLDDGADRWGPQVIEEWVSNATHDDEQRWAESGVHYLSLEVEAEHSVASVRRAERTITDALAHRGQGVGWSHLGGITEYVASLDADD